MQKTEFFGRDNELDILKQCWHRARSGNPQIVNIIADSGVGKTRLVQAFYEWLSTNEQNTENSDPKKYWPQTLGSGRQSRTNPSIEEFDQFDFTTSRIPWLWWGMRWNEIRNEYDSVFSEFHQKLILHLDILEIERSFKKGSLSAVTAMLLDEGIDFASHLVPGLSQAVNLVTLSKKIKRNLDERKEKQRSLLEQQKSVIDALESEVIKRLHQLYTPNRNDVTTDVPLVIFLDDIQFAADVRNDEATLNFIDKLIRQAKELEWPILFIATHWKTSWLIHGYDEDQKSKVTWRRMIDDIENKKTFLPDNVNSIA